MARTDPDPNLGNHSGIRALPRQNINYTCFPENHYHITHNQFLILNKIYVAKRVPTGKCHLQYLRFGLTVTYCISHNFRPIPNSSSGVSNDSVAHSRFCGIIRVPVIRI